jgi:hypothetical protein
MKAVLMHPDRQMGKYEAIWRFCGNANAHKNHMTAEKKKTYKVTFRLR